MTKEQAIRKACRTVGFRSAMSQLLEVATDIYADYHTNKVISASDKLVAAGVVTSSLIGELMELITPLNRLALVRSTVLDFCNEYNLSESHLLAFARLHFDYKHRNLDITYQHACNVRKKYQRRVRREYDCRTNRHIPGRNMIEPTRRAVAKYVPATIRVVCANIGV